jgi:hypothetical protein
MKTMMVNILLWVNARILAVVDRMLPRVVLTPATRALTPDPCPLTPEKGIVLFGGPYDGHAMDEAADAEVLLMRHQETREVWAYARSKDVVGGRRVYRVQIRVAHPEKLKG